MVYLVWRFLKGKNRNSLIPILYRACDAKTYRDVYEQIVHNRKSVSYTHLDVYKRQTLGGGKKNKTGKHDTLHPCQAYLLRKLCGWQQKLLCEGDQQKKGPSGYIFPYGIVVDRKRCIRDSL